MDVELHQIRQFLAAHHPFDLLPDAILDQLPARLDVRYFRRGSLILSPDKPNHQIHIIRAGAVEVHNPEGALLARLGEGDVFGHRAIQAGGVVESDYAAMEDALLYQLPEADFRRLCAEHLQFDFFFNPVGGARLRDAMAGAEAAGGEPETPDEPLPLLSVPAGEILDQPPLMVGLETSIGEAARRMTEFPAASLLVMDGDRLAGILTDSDIRARVVAAELDPQRPVREVMTAAPIAIDGSQTAFDALILMAEQNIRHLPVMENGRVKGLLTEEHFAPVHSASGVRLVGQIHCSANPEELREVLGQKQQVLTQLDRGGVPARRAARMVTAISDAATLRLLAMAERQLGPPPVPYSWMTAGSQARYEQTAQSDQDNCLLLDDAFDPDQHGDYFTLLANFVCDGLNDCGFEYCPGQVMAKTAKWRQPRSVWRDYFRRWIDEPSTQALMLASVFFDLRHLHGDAELFTGLRKFVLDKARGNHIFLAHMASNALSREPPLGFFRNFVLIWGGENNHTFDMKHNGVVPIIDLARLHALGLGFEPVNTQQRLAAVGEGGAISAEGARDLADALTFMEGIRLRHQSRRIQTGREPNNFIAPEELSNFERTHLKDAFSIVKTIQAAVAMSHQTARFG